MRHDSRYPRFRPIWFLVAFLSIIGWQVSSAEEPETTKPPRELLALVNDDSIFTDDVDAVFGNMHAAMSTEQKTDFDYRKLLNKLINDRLLAQEAMEIGMLDDSAVAVSLAARERDYAVRAFISASFVPNDSAGRAEILDYFNENYRTRQLRTVSVASQEEATKLAEMVLRGASMDSISRATSVDIYRYQGGLHRPKFWADIDPDFRKYLPVMKEGDLVGPFPYRQVYAFMRLEKSTPADTAELPKYEAYINSIVKLQKRTANWKTFTLGLRDNYHMKIDSILLKDIISQGSVRIDSVFMHGTKAPLVWLNDSVTTTDREFRQKLAHGAMGVTTQPFDSVTFRILNEQIDNAVLANEAFRAGFNKQPLVLSRLTSTRDSILIEVYLRETVVPKITLNREEMDRYYQEHQSDFLGADEYVLKQALFARQELADSVVTLLNDGADFDFVVKKYVEDKLSVIDKDQWISLASYPAQIQDDLAHLAVGKTSKAYPTTDGWLVFKVKNRRPGKVRSREEVEVQIREIMFQRRFDEQMDKILATLKEHSRVVTYEDAVNRYFGGSGK